LWVKWGFGSNPLTESIPTKMGSDISTATIVSVRHNNLYLHISGKMKIKSSLKMK